MPDTNTTVRERELQAKIFHKASRYPRVQGHTQSTVACRHASGVEESRRLPSLAISYLTRYLGSQNQQQKRVQLSNNKAECKQALGFFFPQHETVNRARSAIATKGTPKQKNGVFLKKEVLVSCLVSVSYVPRHSVPLFRFSFI